MKIKDDDKNKGRGGKEMKYPEDFINKTILGNSLEIMKDIPSESIDCIITDPPYGIRYESNYYKDGNPFGNIKNDTDFSYPIDELYRILKPTGCLFIFFSYKQPIIDSRIKNVIIWVKNNWSAGDLFGDFGNQYESIAFIPKPKFKLLSNTRYLNVWNFDRIKPKYHPTEKPKELVRRLIECGSNKDDIVFNPFLGSGTTSIVAKEEERRYIGIEIDEKYYEIAKERVNLLKPMVNWL